MNRMKFVGLGCGAIVAALLSGCGGSGSGNATISGKVTGLAANSSVVLTLNGGNSLTVSNGGTAAADETFSFPNTISSQGSYNVQVATPPTNQSCSVSYGSGVVDFSGDSISNVLVACSGNATIGAIVTGLDSGNSVVLSLTLPSTPPVLETTVTANGTINYFTNAGSTAAVTLPLETLYTVAVATQPTNPKQVCTLASGSAPATGGVISSDPITVTFNCQ